MKRSPYLVPACRFLATLGVLVVMFSLPGCGKEGGIDPTPAVNAPEQIGHATVKAIQAKDYDAFARLCMTKEQMAATLDQVLASGELTDEDVKYVQRTKERIDEFFAEHDSERRKNFQAILTRINWSGVTVIEVKAKIKHDEGMDQGDLIVELSNGRVLDIDDVIRTPTGWYIAEDRALRIRQTPEEIEAMMKDQGKE